MTIDPDALRNLILELVCDHDGEWGWYQLDRGLSLRGVVGVRIPAEVAALVRDGLLRVEGDPALAASRLWITALGRAHVETERGRLKERE